MLADYNGVCICSRCYYLEGPREATYKVPQRLSGWAMCPVEILNLIFDLLSPTEYRALCLVNRRLRASVEPFLYSELHCIWREVRFPPPIIRFLQTVTRRPELASHIKRIHLDGNRFLPGYNRYRITTIPVSGIELDELSVFIRGTGAPYCGQWIQELSRGNTDAIIALLLAQPLNLRYLYIGPVFSQLSELIGMVLHSRLCERTVDLHHHHHHHQDTIPDFQHLQDVTFLLNVEDDQNSQFKLLKNTANVQPFFYLPNIQHLSVSIENPGPWTWPTADPPIPSTLTSLDLTCIREKHLGKVVSVTRNVQTLRWKLYYHQGLFKPDQGDTHTIDLDRIADAMSLVRETLTDLTISAGVDIGACDQFFPEMMLTGSSHALVNLDKVKKLEIPWAFLVGLEQDMTKRLQDSIPRNVEFVILTDDLRYLDWGQWEWEDHAILSLLGLWLEDSRSCTPNLRGIVLLFEWVNDDEWCPRMRDQARELGFRTGVSLEVVL